MMTNDFSNWDTHLFKYAIDLLTNQGVLIYNETNKFISLSDKHNEIQKEISGQVDSHLYWLGFGVGIECLAKAVLLKHHLLTIRKVSLKSKNDYDKRSFNTYEEKKRYTEKREKDVFWKVYQHVNSIHVTSNKNEWLDNVFKEKGIKYAREILTPTLGRIQKEELPKLLKKNLITSDDYSFLGQAIKTFIDIRRNVDAHIYLKARTVGSINNDIENIYIPMINMLANIFHNKKLSE